MAGGGLLTESDKGVASSGLFLSKSFCWKSRNVQRHSSLICQGRTLGRTLSIHRCLVNAL